MDGKYVLLRELAPADSGGNYVIATWDAASRTYKAVFFEDTEDKARATHHRMLFGYGVD